MELHQKEALVQVFSYEFCKIFVKFCKILKNFVKCEDDIKVHKG